MHRNRMPAVSAQSALERVNDVLSAADEMSYDVTGRAPSSEFNQGAGLLADLIDVCSLCDGKDLTVKELKAVLGAVAEIMGEPGGKELLLHLREMQWEHSMGDILKHVRKLDDVRGEVVGSKMRPIKMYKAGKGPKKLGKRGSRGGKSL